MCGFGAFLCLLCQMIVQMRVDVCCVCVSEREKATIPDME